jgi:hypothetical protein
LFSTLAPKISRDYTELVVLHQFLGSRNPQPDFRGLVGLVKSLHLGIGPGLFAFANYRGQADAGDLRELLDGAVRGLDVENLGIQKLLGLEGLDGPRLHGGQHRVEEEIGKLTSELHG